MLLLKYREVHCECNNPFNTVHEGSSLGFQKLFYAIDRQLFHDGHVPSQS